MTRGGRRVLTRGAWLALALLAGCAAPPAPGEVARMEPLRAVTLRETHQAGARIGAGSADVEQGRIALARCATATDSVVLFYLRGAEALAPGTLVEAEAGDPAHQDGARPGRVLRVLADDQPAHWVRGRAVIRCQGP